MTAGQRLAKQLSYELRKRREARGLTYEALSDLCGLTPVFIQQIESGRRDPSLSEVTALALALECEARDLLAAQDDVLAEGTSAMPTTQDEPRRKHN